MRDFGAPPFVCPDCRASVGLTTGGYRCSACALFYPVLFGIPDFRIRGDQYLSLDDDREKAGRLHNYGLEHDFASLLAFYYSITDDVPGHLAPGFADYVLNAADRARLQLQLLAPSGGRILLDLGCGSGGALVAGTATFQTCVGVDIALRWLVVAQKRLAETGVDAQLVCADAEALPFADRSFSHVLGSDLLENTRSPKDALCSAASAMGAGGRIYISASNRRWIGPHAATRVWAAGLLHDRVRSKLLRRRHSVDILRAVSFVSPASVRRMAQDCNLRHLATEPFVPGMGQLQNRSAVFRVLARTYSLMARTPLTRTIMTAAGPVFQSVFTKEGVS